MHIKRAKSFKSKLRAKSLLFITLTIYAKKQKTKKQNNNNSKAKKGYIHVSHWKDLMFTQSLLGVELKSLMQFGHIFSKANLSLQYCITE